MREADGECDDIAVDEDRPNHLDVVQMVAAERTKIIDQNVAVVQAAGQAGLSAVPERVSHRPEMDRNIPPWPTRSPLASVIADDRSPASRSGAANAERVITRLISPPPPTAHAGSPQR